MTNCVVTPSRVNHDLWNKTNQIQLCYTGSSELMWCCLNSFIILVAWLIRGRKEACTVQGGLQKWCSEGAVHMEICSHFFLCALLFTNGNDCFIASSHYTSLPWGVKLGLGEIPLPWGAEATCLQQGPVPRHGTAWLQRPRQGEWGQARLREAKQGWGGRQVRVRHRVCGVYNKG